MEGTTFSLIHPIVFKTFLKKEEVSHFNEDLVHNSTLYNVQVYEMIKICTYFTKQNKKCLISVKLENQKFMLLCWLSRFHSMLIDSLQVQTGRKYDVSLDASYSCKESDRKLMVLFVVDFISLVTY